MDSVTFVWDPHCGCAPRRTWNVAKALYNGKALMIQDLDNYSCGVV